MKINFNDLLRRSMLLLAALVVSVSSFAFSFVGKTFKGSEDFDGTSATVTIRFMANNRASSTLTGTGIKTITDSHCYWEEAGGFINFYDSTGNISFLRIDWGENYGEEWDVPQLDMLDNAGYTIVTLKYVPNATSGSKSTAKKKKRK